MNFWESELGEVTGNERDAFAKEFKKIPDGTMSLAKIESFTNTEYKGKNQLTIEWVLVDGDFKGRNQRHNLYVFDDDEKRRFRSLNMLKLIYKLFKVSPKNGNPPQDSDLQIFVGKVAGIKIRETEPNDDGNTSNWVSEVHNSEGFKCETGISVVVHKQNTFSGIDSALSRNSNKLVEDLTDDIPF